MKDFKDRRKVVTMGRTPTNKNMGMTPKNSASRWMEPVKPRHYMNRIQLQYTTTQ
jgi:hypothetical protein